MEYQKKIRSLSLSAHLCGKLSLLSFAPSKGGGGGLFARFRRVLEGLPLLLFIERWMSTFFRRQRRLAPGLFFHVELPGVQRGRKRTRGNTRMRAFSSSFELEIRKYEGPILTLSAMHKLSAIATRFN